MSHTTHSIIMVPPTDFHFNEETAQDNEFQNKVEQPHYLVKESALEEFNVMVNQLRDHHLEVLLLNKRQGDPEMPDAVFPNNWFCTRADGSIDIFPMKAANRKQEARLDALTRLLEYNGYNPRVTHDLRQGNQVLEGTGAMVFDHLKGKAYATLSERCEQDLFEQYCRDRGYHPISFHSTSSKGTPFYHTNVMMSVGEQFAVICLESIADAEERESLLSSLHDDNKQIINIDHQQAEQAFCANILQLRNQQNEPVIVMSQTAFQGFDKKQKQQLEAHGRLICCDIKTIETIGGGSARCMVAENFLPKS
ncbi:citrulline utilization hydrolase CtlX [Kangiella sediminilitoris]|uniref:Amidinotransferase n=1 Tax=Kangiella sediminilitoris TaxID=1144748 RepID=A0A1B3B8W8_9GAMM|nr:arginine deiminase-related protein [Kangiella sediminilitoris]AOE49221.1 hypothetical protein KS2013_497 [Kangiella sediminilitoris]